MEKGNLPEDAVLLDRDSENRVDMSFKETVQIRHVIVGIRPHVKIVNQYPDANSVTSACSGTKRFTVSLTRS